MQTASALGRQPIFPPLYRDTDAFVPPIILSRSSHPSLAHLSEVAGQDVEGLAKLRTVFLLLRRAIHSQESLAASAGTIRVIMLSAEKSILDHLFAPDSSESHQRSYDHQRVAMLFLAAHLFLYVGLREVPTSSQVAQALATRLQIAVGNAQANPEVWRGRERALLFAAFVGMLGAKRAVDPGCQWFKGVFSSVFSVIEREEAISLTRSSAQSLLESFLWRDKLCQDALEDWWRNRQSADIPAAATGQDRI